MENNEIIQLCLIILIVIIIIYYTNLICNLKKQNRENFTSNCVDSNGNITLPGNLYVQGSFGVSGGSQLNGFDNGYADGQFYNININNELTANNGVNIKNGGLKVNDWKISVGADNKLNFSLNNVIKHSISS